MIKVPCVKKFEKAVRLGHGLFLRGEALDLWARAGSGCVGNGGRRQWDDSGLFGGHMDSRVTWCYFPMGEAFVSPMTNGED